MNLSPLAYKLFTDYPITDKVPKNYMLKLIEDLEEQIDKGKLDGKTALKVLAQAVKDYNEEDPNKVISIFSKPKKRA